MPKRIRTADNPAPTPANRPTEYITAFVAALLAVVLLFWHSAPDGFASACLGLVAATCPLVTWIVASRRRTAARTQRVYRTDP